MSDSSLEADVTSRLRDGDECGACPIEWRMEGADEIDALRRIVRTLADNIDRSEAMWQIQREDDKGNLVDFAERAFSAEADSSK